MSEVSMQKRQISDIQKLTGLYTENTLQTYFKKRNEKDTIAWVKEVTTGIDPKFSLLKTESVDAEQLEAVYDLGMRIKELQRAVEMRGLNEVFMLEHCSNQEDEDMENFLPCVEVVGNILKEYSKVTLDTVCKCVRYTMEYHEEHLVWGLTLTFRLMEQCCEPELCSRVNERFMTIPIEEQGGPTYFKIAMDCIMSVSYNISLALINKKVDHMRIRNYEGENVLTAVSFLRGALNRLEMSDDLPKIIVYKVLNIMQTSSNHRFNNFFAQWYMQLDKIYSRMLAMGDRDQKTNKSTINHNGTIRKKEGCVEAPVGLQKGAGGPNQSLACSQKTSCAFQGQESTRG